MAISKVTLNGETLMDVTSDTVEANTLLSGNTATKNDGTKVTGSYTPVTPTYQTKTITPTKSTQTITPDSNYDALSQVTVNAIPSEYVVPTGTLAISQNGTVNVKNYEYANVNVEGGGGTTVDDTLPVRFLDYDGTVVYSYTAEDFANLTALPNNPSHTGLTAQGWNWSLADAKEYVAEYGMLEIGQMYITDDGKTRIYVDVTEYTLNPTICLGVNGTVEIDWGDESSTDTLTGASLTSGKTATHEYLSSGKYIISLNVVSGSYAMISLNSAQSLFYSTTSDKASDLTYGSRIRKVELGSSVELKQNAFCNCTGMTEITLHNGITSLAYGLFNTCSSLKAIIIPNTVTTLGSNVMYRCGALQKISFPSNINVASSAYQFYACYNLRRITKTISSSTIPNNTFNSCSILDDIILLSGVTSIGTSAFGGCSNLSKIEIPNTVTTIGNNAFYSCNSLVKLVIPASVTSIGTSAFACYGMKEYHFLPTTPPTSTGNIFQAVSTMGNCTIYVPAESLEAYKTATNWSTYADLMVGE